LYGYLQDVFNHNQKKKSGIFFHFTFKIIFINFDKKIRRFFQTAVAAAAANFEE